MNQQASNDDQHDHRNFVNETTKTPHGVQQKTVRSTASQRRIYFVETDAEADCTRGNIHIF